MRSLSLTPPQPPLKLHYFGYELSNPYGKQLPTSKMKYRDKVAHKEFGFADKSAALFHKLSLILSLVLSVNIVEETPSV